MHRLRSHATRLAAALLALAAVHVPGTPARAAVASPSVLAVTGTDQKLYYRTPTSPWTSLGGLLYDAPAYTADGNGGFFFVGVGRDRNLWIRTTRLGWQRFGPTGTNCTGPSLAYDAAKRLLSVACQGANSKMYTAVVPVPSSGLPVVRRFTDRGGSLLYGTSTVLDPAAAEGAGAFQYYVVGSNHKIYVASGSGGFRFSGSAFRCFGPLPMEQPNACAAEDGSLQVEDLTYFTSVKTIPGRMVGRPGVSIGPDDKYRYHVVGTNSRFYTATQVRYGDEQGTVTGFTNSPSGSGLYGISAGAGDGGFG